MLIPLLKRLAALAKFKGVKTVVGTQARASPLVLALRSIVLSGEIGDVISTAATDNFSGLPVSIANYLPTILLQPQFIH
jgi:predicted dehydrogenase